ncbi:MAG: FG-GAP-like repeat-containing protein [Gemmatimonadota bacterium]
MSIGRFHHLGLVVVTLSLVSACDDPSAPEEEGEPAEEVSAFFEDLPAWSDFSPIGEPQEPTPTGEPEPLPDDTVDVKVYHDDGTVTVEQDVVYACTATPYTMTANPTQIVMYNPDREILWPGAFIQGKSHRDGLGSLLPLVIDERAPIDVSIPSVSGVDNFVTVEDPGQATVGQAIGDIVGDATQSGLASPSAISFAMRTHHSEEQVALSMEASGNYMGFEASASGDYSRDVSETTITANFVQRMFEVVVGPPSSPGGWFGDGFTQEKLEEQVSLGRIGPDNLPVYVSNIVYGRMMMFSLTSSASETEIRATLQAAYNGIGGSAEASLSAEQKSILQESKIAVASLGGDAQATLDVIRSGDWSQFFTEDAALSSASPLTYTFRNLGDNSIATVTETTEYDVRECLPRAVTSGVFEMPDGWEHTAPISAPFHVVAADVNGDGNDDLVWNHLGPSSNEFYIGIANGDGSFTDQAAIAHPDTPDEGWADYRVLAADVTGDGADDLIWSHLDAQNRTYIAVSDGDGNFTFGDPVTHTAEGWTAYTPFTGDVDRDGRMDLIWNGLRESNGTYVGRSDGEGGLELLPMQEHPAPEWSDYRAFVADVNGDGRADLAWNQLRSTDNTMYVGIAGEEAGTFSFPEGQFETGGWAGYTAFLEDVNGDLAADFVFTEDASSLNRTYVYRSDGSGQFVLSARQDSVAGPASTEFVPLVADVTGDGRADLIWNDLGLGDAVVNRVYVALGTTNGEFSAAVEPQTHPETSVDWTQYEVLTADVNGDGKVDIVWNHPAVTNRVYVALSK